MSYIRAIGELKYVDAPCRDYIYCASELDIIDYGKIEDETLVEFFHKMILDNWNNEDALLKQYMLYQLAQKLKVKLRLTPLTPEEEWKKIEEQLKKDRMEDP